MTAQLLTVLKNYRGQRAIGDDWSRVEPGKKDGRKNHSSAWFPSQILRQPANRAFHSLTRFGVIEKDYMISSKIFVEHA